MSERDADRFEDLPILGELRGALAAEMHAAVRPAARRARAGWAVTGLRRATLALAVAVALAVVAVGLLALHHRTAADHSAGPAGRGTVHHTPSPPPNPQVAPAQKLVDRASKQVIAHDHACSPPTNRGATIEHGSPGHAVLSLLGVLRRAPLPPDPTTKVLHGIGWDAGAGVYVNYIRRARTEYGRSYWIVPEARTTPFGPIPARCYAEFHSTLVTDVRHVSSSLRREALGDQHDELAGQRAQAAHRAGLCFIEIGLHVRPHPGAVGFGCGQGLEDVVPGSGGNGSGDRAGGTIMSGMAADGVVSVTIRYNASAKDPARSITSNVVNNVYVLKIPAQTAHQPFPSRWEIKMSDGSVLTPQQLESRLGLPMQGGG